VVHDGEWQEGKYEQFIGFQFCSQARKKARVGDLESEWVQLQEGAGRDLSPLLYMWGGSRGYMEPLTVSSGTGRNLFGRDAVDGVSFPLGLDQI
jgi:hypothetical protein